MRHISESLKGRLDHARVRDRDEGFTDRTVRQRTQTSYGSWQPVREVLGAWNGTIVRPELLGHFLVRHSFGLARMHLTKVAGLRRDVCSERFRDCGGGLKCSRRARRDDQVDWCRRQPAGEPSGLIQPDRIQTSTPMLEESAARIVMPVPDQQDSGRRCAHGVVFT